MVATKRELGRVLLWKFFFFALWATILYLLIAVLETARFSVDETLQGLVLTSMPSVVLQCSLILRD